MLTSQHQTPTNLDLTEDWGATTVTGRDRLEDSVKQQRPWLTTLSPPCTPFLTAFRLSEATQDSLEVAMWVALTQHQAGRKFLFTHPACASSWSTEMVSFVAGLEGVIRVTGHMCALGMADVDGRSHRKTTTLKTNDKVVADVFRPYSVHDRMSEGDTSFESVAPCARMHTALPLQAESTKLPLSSKGQAVTVRVVN